MRAAVVGAGDISRVHLGALSRIGVDVAAIVDPDLDRARAAAQLLGAAALPDVDALFTDLGPHGVDVVHVCTPHDQHLPVALAALEAGAHVVLEKPVAHDLPSAQLLVAAAEAASGKVAVCLQNRYNATSRAMREILDGGALGPVRGGSATVAWSRDAAYYRAKPWAGQRARSGGGVLINQAIHTIDLVQWLLGPVTTVSGRVHQLAPLLGTGLQVDVEDTAVLTMRHSGPQGEVRSTMWATTTAVDNAPVTVDIVCEQGSLSLRGDLTVTDADGSRIVSDTVTDATGDDTPAYWGHSHEALIADFYSQLDTSAPFWIGPREALESQRILTEVHAQSGL